MSDRPAIGPAQFNYAANAPSDHSDTTSSQPNSQEARLPAFTPFLIDANVGIFLLQLTGGGALVQWFALWPGDGYGLASLPLLTPWQLVTYSFLHGSLMHLAFNMFALWMFGTELERV